jgi:hypothetical protein
MGTLHKDQRTFVIISHSVILRMDNDSDIRCRENRKSHFTFNSFFNLILYEMMWKNIVDWGRPQTTI